MNVPSVCTESLADTANMAIIIPKKATVSIIYSLSYSVYFAVISSPGWMSRWVHKCMLDPLVVV